MKFIWPWALLLCMVVTMATATRVRRSSTGCGQMRMVMGVSQWEHITQKSLEISLKRETREYLWMREMLEYRHHLCKHQTRDQEGGEDSQFVGDERC